MAEKIMTMITAAVYSTHLNEFIFIGKGIAITLQLLLGSIFIGLLLGILLAIARYNGWMVFTINRFISITRGTPLILQLSFFYFALPGLLNFQYSIIGAGIVAFGFNSSAYIAEILRTGIESLPHGQFEAAATLHIPTNLMWRDIILPQVLRNVLPALINELILLVKETALISTIGGMDLMRRAQSIAAEQFSYFAPICMAGFYYYALVLLLEHLGKLVEQKWSRK